MDKEKVDNSNCLSACECGHCGEEEIFGVGHAHVNSVMVEDMDGNQVEFLIENVIVVDEVSYAIMVENVEVGEPRCIVGRMTEEEVDGLPSVAIELVDDEDEITRVQDAMDAMINEAIDMCDLMCPVPDEECINCEKESCDDCPKMQETDLEDAQEVFCCEEHHGDECCDCVPGDENCEEGCWDANCVCGNQEEGSCPDNCSECGEDCNYADPEGCEPIETTEEN